MKRSQHFDAQYLSGQSLLHRQHPAFFGNKLTRQQLYNNCPSSTQKRELLLLCLSSLSNMHYGANTTVVSPAAVKPHTCIQHCFVTTSFWRGLHVFFLCWIQTLSIQRLLTNETGRVVNQSHSNSRKLFIIVSHFILSLSFLHFQWLGLEIPCKDFDHQLVVGTYKEIQQCTNKGRKRRRL